MPYGGKDVEKLHHSYIAAENEKCYNHFWKVIWQFLKQTTTMTKQYMKPLCDPKITLLSFYLPQKSENLSPHKGLHMTIHTSFTS